MVGGRIGGWMMRCACVAALTMLGGCGSTFVSGLYGSAKNEQPPTPNYANPVAVPSEADPSKPVVIPMDPEAECPQINVPTGTSSYGGGGASPTNVGYQMVLSNYARECTLNPGNTVSIRIGIEGRVLLGTNGHPGTYSAPLRINVRDRDSNTVFSKVVRVSATVPAGQDQGTFEVIENGVVVPLKLEQPLRYYDIQVGFGGSADAPARKKKRRA